MNIMRFSTLYLLFSVIVMSVAIAVLIAFGLNLGIDFKGGSVMEVAYEGEVPTNQVIAEQISGLDIGTPHIQPIGEKGIVIRMQDITEEVHQSVLLSLGEGVTESKFESIGPVIGKELQEKTIILVSLSLLAIVLYITFAFRRISGQVRFWHWSFAALFALVHDLLVPLGVFAVLGFLYDIQINIPIVVALLTVVGYSINDTVVVFDRIRENIGRKPKSTLSEIVDLSIKQALSRSLGTSTTTLFVLVSLYFLGGETLRYFALALIAGVIAGTYSSLFVAPTILVKWLGRRNNIDK